MHSKHYFRHRSFDSQPKKIEHDVIRLVFKSNTKLIRKLTLTRGGRKQNLKITVRKRDEEIKKKLETRFTTRMNK